MNEKITKFQPLYLLSAIYIIIAYASPIASLLLAGKYEEAPMGIILILFFPLLLGIVNLFIVLRKKSTLDRQLLLNCSVMIKYLMIPLYIVGGLLNAILFLLIFTPVIVMMFASPMLIGTLCMFGWIYMVGAAPFSIAYIIKSKKKGVHGKVLSTIAIILQFFFTADVISIMFLALKEKRHIVTTIIMILLLILGFIGSVIGLIVLFLSLA